MEQCKRFFREDLYSVSIENQLNYFLKKNPNFKVKSICFNTKPSMYMEDLLVVYDIGEQHENSC